MAGIGRLTIDVRFAPDPVSDPVQEWILESDGELELEIDESALDDELASLFKGAGASSAFLLQRTLSTGGWGSTGLTVLEVVITVGTGVASNAVYDALKALFRKVTGEAPVARQKHRGRKRKKAPSARRRSRSKRS